MRINTDGKKEYRSDLYERTAEALDEETKSGAIDAACIHAKQDIEGKSDAIEFLAEELPAAKLETVAEILSTDEIVVTTSLEIDIETQAETTR